MGPQLSLGAPSGMALLACGWAGWLCREVIEGTKAKVEAVRKTKKSLQRLAQKHSADHGTSAAELRKCANKANKCLGELVRTLEGYREKGPGTDPEDRLTHPRPGQIQKNASRLQKLYDVASKAQQAYRDERAGHDQRLEGLTRAMGDVAEALQGAEEDCIAFGRDVSRQVIEQQANCLTGHLDETLAFLQAIETISPQRATAAFVQANRHNQPNPEFALAAPDELPPMSQLLNESAPPMRVPQLTVESATSTPQPEAPRQVIMVAVADYTASEEGELTFKQGDRLIVEATDPSGWYPCQLGTLRAPSAAPESAAAVAAALSEASSGPSPAAPAPAQEPPAEEAAPPASEAQSDNTLAGRQCRAEYEYTAADADELPSRQARSISIPRTYPSLFGTWVGLVGPWSFGAMVRWGHGQMGPWSDGAMVRWGPWSDGGHGQMGAMLLTIQGETGGWMYGTNSKGKSGFFPPSYVTVL
ncbi:hypothetical protein PAPYR_2097 [Paratrimastix pyriformis]|uniref:SH3 domain-containing protein n=1 Tax=Paratrimastix pyriformis TaxID=342808 RepID=A0ABQ8UVC3_9EUKA|nr:hypothetical protein PAPYR_2097 [Paratrimastix pyriformis]